MKINQKDKKLILRLVRKHLGKDNPIMVKEIMEHVPLNDREIRKVIQLLVNESKQPIGSTTRGPYGFFIIVSFDDYLEAVRNLFNRKDKIQERIDSLRDACRKSGLDMPEVKVYENDGNTTFDISNSVVIYLK